MRGFHGTDKITAQTIRSSNNWEEAKVSDVLGYGVYFFVDADEATAITQAQHYHLGSKPYGGMMKALKTTISIPSTFILLNLDTKIAEMILEKAENVFEETLEPSKLEELRKNEDIFHGALIDWFCEFHPQVIAIQKTLMLPNSYVRKQVPDGSAVCACIRIVDVIGKVQKVI